MDKNKETLAAMLRLSAAAWAEYEKHNDQRLWSLWAVLDQTARDYGKDFYKDQTWGLFLVAEDLVKTL